MSIRHHWVGDRRKEIAQKKGGGGQVVCPCIIPLLIHLPSVGSVCQKVEGLRFTACLYTSN